MALPRVLGQVGRVDVPRNAGGDAKAGAEGAGEDVRQVLVSVAGGPRRPPSPGGAGADDVAPKG